MQLHAIIPVKTLTQAKSRLQPALSAIGRQQLMREMLTRVISTLRMCPADPAQPELALFHTIWVVSRDVEVLELAHTLGAQPIVEHGTTLNGALEQARRVVRAAGATALLIVPADLPLVTPADLRALAQALCDGADLVLAPDSAEQGTNALGVWLSTDLPFHFGTASFPIHRAHAAWHELMVTIYRSPTLGLDVDTPPHLQAYRAAS